MKQHYKNFRGKLHPFRLRKEKTERNNEQFFFTYFFTFLLHNEHIFYLVLEKLFFRFFVCMEVTKQNSIENIVKKYFFLEI